MYIRNIFIALDQLLNALLRGSPNETISDRLGRNAKEGSRLARIACWLIGKLLFKDTGHCYE